MYINTFKNRKEVYKMQKACQLTEFVGAGEVIPTKEE